MFAEACLVAFDLLRYTAPIVSCVPGIVITVRLLSDKQAC